MMWSVYTESILETAAWLKTRVSEGYVIGYVSFSFKEKTFHLI
jgi:hypothetical protein